MERAPTDENVLHDLVETRLEAPTVEYKRWMALSEGVVRANVARHICALANVGGGYLVFGFEDDGTPSEPPAADLTVYGQDAINGIVERYLQPPVHCVVTNVAATSGRTYPVVRVPSHGAQPICAKRDGPQDGRGRPAGIHSGVHYIRVQGPKSVPIDSPERWRDVIHRCVVAERDGLLSSIGRLFDRPTASTLPAVLASWMNETLAEWPKVLRGQWPIDHLANRAAFGFRLVTSTGDAPEPLPVGRLQEAIRSASFTASDELRLRSTAFEMRWSEDAKPNVAVFDDAEGYEFRTPALDRYSVGELWRVAGDGRGAVVQPFSEDSPWNTEAVQDRGTRKWPAGGKLSPRFQISFVAEHIAFTRAFAKSFPDVTGCELAVDYVGLAGRHVDEPAPGVYFGRSAAAAAAGRRVTTRVSLDLLAADLPEAVASLVGPVFRLFDGWDVGPDYVRKALESLR